MAAEQVATKEDSTLKTLITLQNPEYEHQDGISTTPIDEGQPTKNSALTDEMSSDIKLETTDAEVDPFVESVRATFCQLDHKSINKMRIIKRVGPNESDEDFIINFLDELYMNGKGRFIQRKNRENTVQFHCERHSKPRGIKRGPNATRANNCPAYVSFQFVSIQQQRGAIIRGKLEHINHDLSDSNEKHTAKISTQLIELIKELVHEGKDQPTIQLLMKRWAERNGHFDTDDRQFYPNRSTFQYYYQTFKSGKCPVKSDLIKLSNSQTKNVAEMLSAIGFDDLIQWEDETQCLVPSESEENFYYEVNVIEASCGCEATKRTVMCQHLHLALMSAERQGLNLDDIRQRAAEYIIKEEKYYRHKNTLEVINNNEVHTVNIGRKSCSCTAYKYKLYCVCLRVLNTLMKNKLLNDVKKHKAVAVSSKHDAANTESASVAEHDENGSILDKPAQDLEIDTIQGDLSFDVEINDLPHIDDTVVKPAEATSVITNVEQPEKARKVRKLEVIVNVDKPERATKVQKTEITTSVHKEEVTVKIEKPEESVNETKLSKKISDNVVKLKTTSIVSGQTDIKVVSIRTVKVDEQALLVKTLDDLKSWALESDRPQHLCRDVRLQIQQLCTLVNMADKQPETPHGTFKLVKKSK